MISSVRVKNIAEGLKCLKNYIRKREEKGKSTIIFSEDRLTLLVERALCEEMGGSMLTDVTTFSRYIKRKSDTVLSKQASVVKTGEIMLELKNSLLCFNKDYSAKAAAKSVYETIAQFSACSITPEMLNGAKLNDRVLSMKISDVAAIYEKYLGFLSSGGYADENSMLSLLPSAIYSDKFIKREGVVFFEFASFTSQAKEGLRAAMDAAEEVLGIFESGDEEFYTREGEGEFLSVASDFGGAKSFAYPSVYDELRSKLSFSLFDPETFKKPSLPTDRVKVFECATVNDEVCLSAVLIKKHISEGMRFKDITLFVPDTAAYLPEISRVFSEYKISYFADEKKSLLSHPVAKFVLSVFKAVDERLSPSSVDELLSSVFFDGFGEYRNYLSKFALSRGGVKAPLKSGEVLEKYGYDGEYLSACREKVLTVLKMVKSRDSGVGYCASVRDILSFVNADRASEDMISSSKDVALKGYLSQIGGVTDRILKEITAISGGGEFTAGEFCDVLSGGFSSAEISIVPLKSDAVFVGDINSSKVNDSKTVIALGLTDDVPLTSLDVALISDREIIKLKGENIDVAPLISQVNMRSKERAALNILSFTDNLYLSYPVTSGGDEKSRSEIITYILRALSDKNGNKMRAQRNYSLFPFSCSELVPAEKQLYIERSLFKSGQKKDLREYSAVAAVMEEEGIAIGGNSGEKKNISHGEIFFKGESGGEEKFLSPTLIENFNSCPYKNFMERGIGLKEREEGMIKTSDSGNFIHEMLKIVGEGIKSGEVKDLSSCRVKSKEAGEEILSRPEYKSLKDTPSDSYYADKLVFDGIRICEGMFSQLDGGDFSVSELEKYCRISEIGVHGRVDRVDVSDSYLRVIDYKTGETDASLSSYYVGVKLQLQLYMLSALGAFNNGEKKPAGLFYFPARVDFKTADDEPPFALTGFASESAVKESEGILGRCVKIPDGGFEKFLDYAKIMVASGKKKMREGFISPVPYGNVCGYCRFGGLCGYDGEGRKADYSRLTPSDIINVVSGEEE